MMGLAQIQSASRKAARESAKEKKGPLMVEAEDLLPGVLEEHLIHIPFLGDRTPRGFRKIDTREALKDYPYSELFVDASGWGREGEAALTFNQFCAKVRELGPGYAYAVSESGQFQIQVRVMK